MMMDAPASKENGISPHPSSVAASLEMRNLDHIHRSPLAHSLDASSSEYDSSSPYPLHRRTLAYAHGNSSKNCTDALNLDPIAVIDPNESDPSEDSKKEKKHWYKGHFRKTSTNKIEEPVPPKHGDIFTLSSPNHRWKKYKFHLDEGCIFRVKSNGQEVISLFLGSVKATQIKEKDGGKVAYGFEIITPSATTSFYVESEEERTAWIESIQNVCNRMTITSIVDGVPDKVIESPDTTNHEEIREALRKLLQEEGNNKCADCNSSDTHWASINLGIFICIKCSGVHRRLGTHISKVRSVDLDVWDPETLEHMKEVGNLKSNAIYEHSVPPQYTKPTEDSDDILRERWIFAKYQRRRFCADYVPTSPMLPTIPSGSSISSPYSLTLNSTPISPLANNPHIAHRRSRSSTAPETNPLTKPLRPSMTVTLSPPTTYLTLPKSPRHSSHVPVSPRSRSPSPTPIPAPSLHSSLMASYPPLRPATKTATPEPNTPHPVKDYPNNESLQLLKDSILQLLRNDKSFRDEVREILAQDK